MIFQETLRGNKRENEFHCTKSSRFSLSLLAFLNLFQVESSRGGRIMSSYLVWKSLLHTYTYTDTHTHTHTHTVPASALPRVSSDFNSSEKDQSSLLNAYKKIWKLFSHRCVCVCVCVCAHNTHLNPSACQTLHRTHCRNNLRLNENKCPSSFSIIKYISSLSLFLWVWWEFMDVMLSLRTTSISPDPPGGLRVCACVLSSTVCIFWDITERRESGRGYLNRATQRDYSMCMQVESALVHLITEHVCVCVCVCVCDTNRLLTFSSFLCLLSPLLRHVLTEPAIS